MQTAAEHTTLNLAIEVDVDVARAFDVFTRQFDKVKPREHNLLDVDIAESVLEPWVGGRVYDRGVDGSTCAWGRVLAVDPPHRLVFSWDLSPRWELETDLQRTSEVEVTFTALAEGRTRVALEHRHLDRHGDGWEGTRDGVAAEGGWPLYLARYQEAVAAA